jgi:hypothetical protein
LRKDLQEVEKVEIIWLFENEVVWYSQA